MTRWMCDDLQLIKKKWDEVVEVAAHDSNKPQLPPWLLLMVMAMASTDENEREREEEDDLLLFFVCIERQRGEINGE